MGMIKKTVGTVAKGLPKGASTRKTGTRQQPPGVNRPGSHGYPHKT